MFDHPGGSLSETVADAILDWLPSSGYERRDGVQIEEHPANAGGVVRYGLPIRKKESAPTEKFSRRVSPRAGGSTQRTSNRAAIFAGPAAAT